MSNSDSGNGTTTRTAEHVTGASQTQTGTLVTGVTATSEVLPPSLDSSATSAERVEQPSSSVVGKH